MNALYIVLGALFWLIAALFIRFTGEALFHPGNPWLYLLYAACVPIGWLFLVACLLIGGVPRRAALPPVAVMSATGLLLGGVAILGFPQLYGRSPQLVALGAAWLLWGVGVLLALALWMEWRGEGA